MYLIFQFVRLYKFTNLSDFLVMKIFSKILHFLFYTPALESYSTCDLQLNAEALLKTVSSGKDISVGDEHTSTNKPRPSPRNCTNIEEIITQITLE